MNLNPSLRSQRTALAAAALALLTLPLAAQAQVFGSLANFDAVNDTGHEAHGFEIEIEDASYDHSKIYSVFGLDRNFGVPPTSVERYGAPVITDVAGFGVRIRYAASFLNGAWSVGTPTGPYPFAGDSCWPLGNPQYASGTLSCDHFGIATYGTPAKVNYSWLVDPGNTGTLSLQQAAIPAVQFAYQAPPPGPIVAPRPVVAEIEAHKADNEVFGTPFWVKVYAKHVDHNVKLEDLMKGHADVPGAAEVEVEYEIFQAGDANGNKLLDLALNPADEALVLRYEFYKYLGDLGANGEALCGGGGKGHGKGGGIGPADCGGLGDYVGAQMAALNAVQPALAVPEPETYALLLAGLGFIGLRVRQTRRAG
nr:PEP-CTERM sorting domain-containing protein [uncultured Roseateles sp.]